MDSLMLPVRAAGVCYGVGDNEDPTIGICDPAADVSSCCKYGDYCLSNGLCQAPPEKSKGAYTTYYIAGCTAANTTSGQCLAFNRCKAKGVGVTTCGGGSYCCYGLGGCNCTDSAQTFSLPSGTFISTLPASAAMPTTSAKSSSGPSTPASASSSTSSASSSTSVIAAASTSASAAAPSSNNSVTVGAGVGVGVAVALLLGIGLGFWLWRRRRNNAGAIGGVSQYHNDHGHPIDAKHGNNVIAPPGYSAAFQPESHRASELDAAHLVEMNAATPPAQLADTSTSKKPTVQSGTRELA